MRLVLDPGQPGGEVTYNSSRLKSLCVELEASFLSILLSEMKKSSPGMFGGGFTGESYQHMAMTELSRHWAETGGIGLADMLYRELSLREYGGKSLTMSNQSHGQEPFEKG